MISVKEKENCCGCTACESICPQNCIKMEEDNEGFLYPFVMLEDCIECHWCEKVCPILQSNNKVETSRSGIDITCQLMDLLKQQKCFPICKAAYIKDEKIRKESTSGGIFTAIARYVLEKNGIVYGVEINANQQVVHSSSNTENELSRFRKSKYVQSNQEGIYEEIQKALLDNQWVLYSGTPCQVEGLYQFLGKETYSNLVTLDVICHGVGSPRFWKKYTSYIVTKYKSEIRKIHFREKTFGYNSPSQVIYLENARKVRGDQDSDLYWSAFAKKYIFRPSCYKCKFKSCNHSADFTIGDYWNASELPENFKKADGCSLVLIHTDKGKSIFDSIQREIEAIDLDIFKALMINGGMQTSMLLTSSVRPVDRDSFMEDMDKMDLRHLMKKYCHMSLRTKLKCLIKPILYKLGILERVKQRLGH